MSVSRAPGPASRRLPDQAPPASVPVVFGSFVGTFQPATTASGRAVLMLSPFGYEELCARRFYTILADRLADAGVASLRFDFPGTGNALDGEADGLEDWLAAAGMAADALRGRSGVAAPIVLGQGLGGTLALHWAERLGPLAGLVLLEPAASGRAYLRGLSAWGKTIAAASGLDPAANMAGPYGVAGFGLPEPRAAAIRRLDVARLTGATLPPTLLLEQAGGAIGKALTAAETGCPALARHAFHEYAALLTDPTGAVLPQQAMSDILAWVSERTPATMAEDASPPPAPLEAETSHKLCGEGFDEQPIRFGPDQRLAGTLCLPHAADPNASALVIVSAGRDHSIGWARSAVAQARAMARAGVATLRFDVSGIGDSRTGVETPAEILYSPAMCLDVRAAVDQLDALGYRSIGLVGRCSGAWAAFTHALDDVRIRGVALVNLPYFLWDPAQSLAEVINVAHRDIGDLGATLLRRDGLSRLLKGQLSFRNAARILSRQFDLRVLRPAAPFLGPLTAESRRYHELHRLFARLKARSVPMLLLYAAGDGSLNELRSFMGQDLRRLERYPAVRVREIADADHNITPERARAALADELLGFFARPQTVAVPAVANPQAACSHPARRHLVPGQV